MKFMQFNLVFNTVHSERSEESDNVCFIFFADVYRFFAMLNNSSSLRSDFRRVVEDFVRKMTETPTGNALNLEP